MGAGDEILSVLKRLEGKVDKLLLADMLREIPAIAEDASLEEKGGDPQSKIAMKKWVGKDYKGKHFSEVSNLAGIGRSGRDRTTLRASLAISDRAWARSPTPGHRLSWIITTTAPLSLCAFASRWPSAWPRAFVSEYRWTK